MSSEDPIGKQSHCVFWFAFRGHTSQWKTALSVGRQLVRYQIIIQGQGSSHCVHTHPEIDQSMDKHDHSSYHLYIYLQQQSTCLIPTTPSAQKARHNILISRHAQRDSIGSLSKRADMHTCAHTHHTTSTQLTHHLTQLGSVHPARQFMWAALA